MFYFSPLPSLPPYGIHGKFEYMPRSDLCKMLKYEWDLEKRLD